MRSERRHRLFPPNLPTWPSAKRQLWASFSGDGCARGERMGGPPCFYSQTRQQQNQDHAQNFLLFLS